jgi:transporter family protein
MGISSNWKFLVIIYIIAAGFWGFFLKIILNKLDWKTTMLAITSVWVILILVYLIFFGKEINFSWNRYYILAIMTAIIGALSGVVLYKVLSLKPASIVIPMTAQYVLITALLSFIFLKEPITLRGVFGIVFSIISIILLAGRGQ